MLTQLVMQWDLFRSSNAGNRFLDPRCIFFAEEGTVRVRFFAFVLTFYVLAEGGVLVPEESALVSDLWPFPIPRE